MTGVLLFAAFLLVASVLTLRNWRMGVFFAIVAGVLQDPIRKLTPDTPALLVLSTLPIWLAMAHQILGGGWRAFKQTFPELSTAMGFFVLSLPLPVLIALQYGANAWKLAALGLFGYLAPAAGLALGFAFARRVKEVENLLVFYCLVAAASMVGTFAEYVGVAPGAPILGTEALGGTWIRYRPGLSPLPLFSGFYRSPDVMGWHAATLVMLALTLVLHRRFRSSSTLIGLAAFGVLALLLSGRRKMLMMPVVWALVAGAVSMRGGRASRVVSLAVAGTLILGVAFYARGELGIEEEYFTFAASVTEDGQARVTGGAWGQLWVTVNQSGFLGAGIGLAAQGAQHLGLARQKAWQESGPSRVMVELGIPGFICAVALVFLIARNAYRVLKQPSPAPNLALGLMAVAAANAAAFTVSHQVYGDVVILSLSSFLFGIGLSASTWERAVERPPVHPRLLAEPWRPRRVSG